MLVPILDKNDICVNTTNAPVSIAKHAQNPAKNMSIFNPTTPNSFKVCFIFVPPLFKK